ncbi:MAG: transcriptional regulator [Deltaproteobacteria bacterium]|nr:MAG: transcriptional regulator [Deltaproteobacteria bacterium]
MSAFPRIYRSFAEFEREELRKLDSLRTTVEDLIEEHFAEELDFDDRSRPHRRRR